MFSLLRPVRRCPKTLSLIILINILIAITSFYFGFMNKSPNESNKQSEQTAIEALQKLVEKYSAEIQELRTSITARETSKEIQEKKTAEVEEEFSYSRSEIEERWSAQVDKLNKELAEKDAEEERLKSEINDILVKLGYSQYLLKIPSDYKLRHTQESFDELSLENLTTVIIFSEATQTCLQTLISEIKHNYPDVQILVTAHFNSTFRSIDFTGSEFLGYFNTTGAALNAMIRLVNTEYFFFISPQYSIEPFNSSSSITWLLHALVSIPALDVIGGSLLHLSKELEVPCHRLQNCRWTLSKSYEYKRSYGEMIICHEIETPFMARKASFNSNLTQFDESLPEFVLTDFFLRAREKLIVGSRPEVMFSLREQKCKLRIISREEYIDSLIPFSRKHDLQRFKDSYGKVTTICEGTNPHLCNRFVMIDEWGIPSWKKVGIYPFFWYTERLHRALEIGADLLQKWNITYVLQGGTSLGAVKMRNQLPWDADVDTHVFEEDWERILYLATQTNYTVKFYRKDLINIHIHHPEDELGPFTLRIIGNRTDAPEIIYARIRNRVYPVPRHIFSYLRKCYGDTPFEQRNRAGIKFVCKYGDHSACLPDWRETGGGTFREEICNL